VDGVLGELEAISASWLAEKSTREKGFSLGHFDRDYLRQLPIALVRREGQVLAFANLWPGRPGEELSLDLMRHLPSGPPGVMDYLFIEVLLWGRQQGYAWFSFGLAPFSGMEAHRLAPFWSRAGAFLFRHGEHFYNFQGLRHYKDKFDPEWSPRYLASPGGLAIARTLADVASLVSGGLRGVIAR
jgi:phosphatidylglycerol lysyltransferase